MCRKRDRGQADRVEKPEISNSLLKSMMNRASHGDVDALLGLSTLLSKRIDDSRNNFRAQHTDDNRVEEVRQALAWATQQAWQRRHLKKLSSPDVKRLMDDALRGDDVALERLQLIGEEVKTITGAEANLVAHFVKARLAK